MTQDINQKIEPATIGRDEIDLKEIFSVLWAGKWVLIFVPLIFAIGAVTIALTLPNVYTSTAKLAPTDDGQAGGLGSMGGQLGGLASLAGVRLPQGQIDNASLGIEIIGSHRFLASFIDRHDIAPEIYAIQSWRGGENLRFDRKIFDIENRRWLDIDGESAKPTEWEVVNRFRGMIVINRDERTGFISLSITHQSPILAKEWTEMMITDINNELRRQDVAEAQRSMAYLNEEISGITLSSMREVFYQLIEQQTQTIMLANSRPEYVFRVIDPPVMAERKSGPPRALISIAGLFAGGFFALIFVFARYMIRSNIQRSTYSPDK